MAKSRAWSQEEAACVTAPEIPLHPCTVKRLSGLWEKDKKHHEIVSSFRANKRAWHVV